LGRASNSNGHITKTKTKQADPTALSACLNCQPACIVSLPELSVCLFCFVVATSTYSSKWIFVAASNSTNMAKHGWQYMALINLLNMMSLVKIETTKRHFTYLAGYFSQNCIVISGHHPIS
jgi:hypothetical protein